MPFVSLKPHLNKLPRKQHEVIRSIARHADDQGLHVSLIGGCVRDLLLNQKSLDLDFVVEGDAPAFVRRIYAGKGVRIKTYAQFGTATVTLSDGFSIDFVSSRKEVYPYSGSLPVVQRGSLFEDCFRRDFTVNAMGVCLSSEKYGRLVDYFGGYQDLKEKKVRVLHNASFVDDPTRILRAVRFEQRLGFKIEPVTLRHLKQALKTDVVSNVEPQRYFREFRKILSEPRCLEALGRLYALGGLEFLKTGGSFARQHLQKLQEEIRCYNEAGIDGNYELCYLMALMKNSDLSLVEQTLRSFYLNGTEMQAVISGLRAQALKDFLRQKELKPHALAQAFTGIGSEALAFISSDATPVVRARIMDYVQRLRHVRLEIDGHDLQKIGKISGPAIKRVLNRVRDEKMDGLISTRKEEIEFAQELMRQQ